MKERIQKILSGWGIASRRNAEQMIIDGRIACNGRICHLGDCADPASDSLSLDGNVLSPAVEKVYFMLHKPRGYVTTLSDEKGRKNVTQLIDCAQRVYPIGRLDMDSEGLLLFTNDGAFANALMHPKFQIDKTYHVTVTGFSPENLEKLGKSICLDGYQIQTPKVCFLRRQGEKTVLSVTIHEGRNRQVRRMCAVAGMDVKRLVRVQQGSVALGDLPLGQSRPLTQDEVTSLYREATGRPREE